MNIPTERLMASKYRQIAPKIHKRLLKDRTWQKEFDVPDNPLEATKLFVEKLHEIEKIPPYIMDWILIRYAGDDVGDWEDVSSTLLTNLLHYDQLKHKNRIKGSDRNLQGVKNNTQLFRIVEEYRIKSPEEMEVLFFNNGEAVLSHEDGMLRVIEPQTKEAAIFFGEGTEWCTASKGSRNYFDMYYRAGPLYYILFKSGEKYAIQNEYFEYKNAENVTDFTMLRYPAVKVFAKGSIVDPDLPVEKIAKKFKDGINDGSIPDDEVLTFYLQIVGDEFPIETKAYILDNLTDVDAEGAILEDDPKLKLYVARMYSTLTNSYLIEFTSRDGDKDIIDLAWDSDEDGRLDIKSGDIFYYPPNSRQPVWVVRDPNDYVDYAIKQLIEMREDDKLERELEEEYFPGDDDED